MAIIAFDVDGTIETLGGKPRWEILDLLRQFSKLGHRIILWSGGGKEYAERKMREYKLDAFVDSCQDKSYASGVVIDICFDDESVDLAVVNIKV